MNKRRQNKPGLSAIKDRYNSGYCCWYCGNTTKVSPKKYDGLCMSCWHDFLEDDVQLALFEGVLCTSV